MTRYHTNTRLRGFVALSLLTTCGLVAISSNSFASPTSSRPGVRKAPICTVRGLMPLGEYATSRQFKCFATEKAIRAKGFSKYTTSVPGAQKSRPRRNRFERCGFVAIKNSPYYFKDNEIGCYSAVKRAVRDGLLPLDILGLTAVGNSLPTATPTSPVAGTATNTPVAGAATPTSTPQPASTASPTPTATATPTPTATPTAQNYPPSGDPITYNFVLNPNGAENAAYSGQCTATITGDRHRLSIDCTHNVVGAASAHLHVPPDNTPYCNVLSPGTHYVTECDLSAFVANGVVSGPALISIHSAPGGAGQALIGYLKPN